MLDHIVQIEFRIALIIATAFVLTFLMRRKSAAKRHMVWLLSLILITGASLFTTQAASLPVFAEDIPVVAPMLKSSITAAKAPASQLTQITGNSANTEDVQALLFQSWLVVAGALAAFWLASLLAAALLARSSKQWQDVGGIRVKRSDKLSVPATLGFFRPIILFPDAAVHWPAERVQMALNHELAHVRRHDWFWQQLSRLICIVHWPNLFVWIASEKLRRESELASDDHVLDNGFEAAAYASELLAIAEHGRMARAANLVCMTRTPKVEGRLRAIVDGHRPRKPFSTGVFVGALVFAVLLSVPVVALRLQLVRGQHMDLEHPPTAPAKGVVVDGGGTPIVGARVYAPFLDQNGTPFGSLTTITDKYGKYDFTGRIPAGMKVEEIGAFQKGYAFGFISLVPFQKAEPLVLGHPVAVIVHLLDPAGVPVSGASVMPTAFTRPVVGFKPGENRRSLVYLQLPSDLAENLAVKTGSDGVAQFNGMPQDTDVQFDTDDERYAQMSFPDGRAHIKSDLATLIDVHLSPSSVIEGTVRLNGKPLAGVRVGAQSILAFPSSKIGFGSAFTDAGGHYSMRRLAPSNYNVELYETSLPSDEWTAKAHGGVSVTAGARLTGVDFDLERGAVIEGKVTYDDGTPAVTRVGIYGPAHPQDSGWVQSVLTNKDGTYRAHVPAGRQRVYTMSSEPQQTREVDVSSGGDEKVDFVIH